MTMLPPSKSARMSSQLGGAFGRVELVAALDEPGSGIQVEVGPEGDHEDVGVMGALVGDDPLARRRRWR